MLKHKSKQPTAQELYRERIRREEEERAACLPPGLINHGNTCFMNSTLQGLIATPLLHSLVTFEDLPAASASLSPRRSPQLTNGHGMAGQYEHIRVQGMPLGDVFIELMQRAWGVQQAHRRESLSPKQLLTTIGHKYDQYLDFRQQDAHEFLRHMLDAMRMEELDIIKARQPPLPKNRRRKSRRSAAQKPDTATQAQDASPPQDSAADPSGPSAPVPPPAAADKPEDSERLQSFVDMLFGGKLASFLVCDVCKKVSVTYEDFNDLSLSIKPEDYVKERKRDRFKFLAKKLRFRPKELELSGAFPIQRSSSVPASPVRRSIDPLPHDPIPHLDLDHRRRSLDQERDTGTSGSPDDSDAREGLASAVGTPKRGSVPLSGAVTPARVDDGAREGEVRSPAEREAGTPVHVGFVESVKQRDRGKDRSDDAKEKKDKDDPWGKLQRRLSVSMSKTKKDKDKDKEKRLSRSKERGWRAKHLSADDKSSRAASEERPASVSSRVVVSYIPESGSSDLGDVSDATRSRGISPSPGLSPLSSPALNASGAFPNIHKPSGLSLPDKLNKPAVSKHPKPSREEAAYMRQVLADVHPSSPSTFSMLHQALSHGSTGSGGTSSTPMTAQALLVKLGHLPGIEECLRLFTAVEIMDGENMVGCHRCWKIANGTYQPKHQDIGEPQAESGKDSEEESHDSPVALETPSSVSVADSTQSLLQGEELGSSTSELPNISASSTPILTNSAASSSLFLHDTASVASAPTTVQSTHSEEKLAEVQLATYDGIPIPSISTTAPDTPGPTVPNTARSSGVQPLQDASQTSLSASLQPPRIRKRRRRRRDGLDESSDSSDDEGSTSDVSGDTSYSDTSSVASPSASPTVSPRASLEKLRESVAALQPPQAEKAPPSRTGTGATNGKVPRSQQVIMRKTFKRYLIAVPPPVLVIHLKRFQQISKANPYAMAFSSGFKKLDDYVSFPEYLDLAPFLAPRKEDFGLGKKGKKAKEHESDGRCMYRLYAVVVHIGNMLGGHYIAYTALPPASPLAQQSSHGSSSSSGTSETTPKPPATEPEAARADGSSHHKKHTRQWAYISDQVVRLTTLEEVLKAKAYICMYERI